MRPYKCNALAWELLYTGIKYESLTSLAKNSESHILKSFFFVGGVLLILFGYFGLNYSGFCFAEMRYLSNEEKIRAVFDLQNSRDTLPLDNAPDPKHVKDKSFDGYNLAHIKYKSFDEHIALYPECCSVNPGGGYEVPPVNFLDRIFGYDSGDVVVINFQVRYLEENGSLKTVENRFDNYLQNCDKPQ
ncbi:hypothetical protein [Chroococcidiopsis sp. CCNUC1]|uniref:hypothetical protein n=1 Tax=Chroococcidiopsis sp. CCNUC1 TaxID=2653189 RepID=UPI0020215563|nr:hypothetical protein [Chroococcidiopsis sp. CCNUC1]URD51176.1 hypothetical protein M5J74_04120 [Chroococcidiopsis sp. CCNUC1]